MTTRLTAEENLAAYGVLDGLKPDGRNVVRPIAATVPSIRKLGEVVDILDAQREPVNRTERNLRLGSVPYFGATGQVGFIDRHLFDEELVLLGEDGAPFLDSLKPKAYFVRGKSWVNNHAHVLRGKQGVILNSFLLHQLNATSYAPYVSGTTRLKLPQGPMRRIPLVVPSIPEQQRVVTYLDEQLPRLDASVAALLRAQANLKRYRASVLKAACEGRLVPTEADLTSAVDRAFESGGDLLERILSKRRHEQPWVEEPTKPDIRDLPELPDAWIWASADQLLDRIEAGKSFKCEERPPHDDEVGVLKVSAVSWSEFNEDESKTCTEVERVDVRYMVMSGDFERLSTGNQESMRNIGQARIRQIRVPLPPLAEQHRIVAEADRRLSLIRAAETQVTANLARAKRLRQSILQAAFSA